MKKMCLLLKISGTVWLTLSAFRVRQGRHCLRGGTKFVRYLQWMCWPEGMMVSNSWIVRKLARSECGLGVSWIPLPKETLFGTRASAENYPGCLSWQVSLGFEKPRQLSQWLQGYFHFLKLSLDFLKSCKIVQNFDISFI